MASTLMSLTTVLNKLFEPSRRDVYSWLIILPLLLISSCQKQERAAQTAQPVPAPSTIPARPPGFPPPVMNQPYPATGVVVLINRKEGWIEINHDEIKGLMPAMQMEFWVKDKSLFDNAKAGDRVDFTIVETEKGEYLTELKRASNKSP
ncbi:MAG TPA: copper-binding protein [Pyrinomonadaceae bacterium]|nr:copper-binding protein [Pyrinomonadaceae bacterium]